MRASLQPACLIVAGKVEMRSPIFTDEPVISRKLPDRLAIRARRTSPTQIAGGE